MSDTLLIISLKNDLVPCSVATDHADVLQHLEDVTDVMLPQHIILMQKPCCSGHGVHCFWW